MFLFFTRSKFLLAALAVFLLCLNAAQASVHSAYSKKECGKCHNDPKGKSEALKADMPELCYGCHETYETKPFLHGPVAAGGCTVCHDPHESKNPKLLRESSVNAICTSCHAAKGEMLASDENIHPPVLESCINCHDPHSADYRFQLKADPKKALCLGCHSEKKAWIAQVKFKHGALDMGDQCLGCHNPHSSEQPKLLKAGDSKTLCLQCHNQEQTTDEDKKVLMNIGKHLDDNPDWHGPILWGDCAACHNPHGSDNFRMLQAPFPTGSVFKFTADGYICFQCHEPKKITDKFTEIDTNFRKGNRNLHFVHVNGKGITCRTCHEFHATKEYPHHLRIKSTFGRAQFEIRYIATDNGGSCDPICHSRKSYERLNPK